MNKEVHRQEVQNLLLKRISPAKAHRKNCEECMSGNYHEINKCINTNCASWIFRFGFDPFTKPKSGGNVQNLRNVKINPKGHGSQPLPFNQDSIKEEKAMNICQIPKVPLSVPLCAKLANSISDVKSRMLYFLYERLLDMKPTFFQSEIENIHTAVFHTAETKARKYRQLNAKHDLSECIDRHKSIHRIKKNLAELNKILKGYKL